MNRTVLQIYSPNCILTSGFVLALQDFKIIATSGLDDPPALSKPGRSSYVYAVKWFSSMLPDP